MEGVIRVCVVEDQPVLREALVVLLSQHEFAVAGSAATVEGGFELVTRARPDVAIIDLLLGSQRTEELVGRLLEAVPETRILVYTAVQRPADLEPALASGAHGLLTKAAEPEELYAGLRTLAAGGNHIDERVRRILAESPAEAGPQLSEREREVLVLLARGLSFEQAASTLGLSPDAVRSHTGDAGRNLGARSPLHTIALALQRGEIVL